MSQHGSSWGNGRVSPRQEKLKSYDRSEAAKLAADLWAFTRFIEEAFQGRLAVGPRPNDSS